MHLDQRVAPVKISDTELIDKLGWNPKINLRAGLKCLLMTIKEDLQNNFELK